MKDSDINQNRMDEQQCFCEMQLEGNERTRIKTLLLLTGLGGNGENQPSTDL